MQQTFCAFVVKLISFCFQARLNEALAHVEGTLGNDEQIKPPGHEDIVLLSRLVILLESNNFLDIDTILTSLMETQELSEPPLGVLALTAYSRYLLRVHAYFPEGDVKLGAKFALSSDPLRKGKPTEKEQTCLLLKKFYESRSDAEELLKEDFPENESVAQIIKAGALLRSERFDEAIKIYTRILSSKKEYCVAYNNRGTAWEKLGNYKKAIKDYTNAIEISPHYALAMFNRATAHYDLKNYEEALRDYSDSIKFNPRFADALYNRGNVLLSLNEYSLAIESYKSALEICPNNSDIYYNRGNAYMMMNLEDLALEDWTKALDIDPHNMDAHVHRGNTLFNRQQYQEAIQHYDKLLEAFPDEESFKQFRSMSLQMLK